MRGGRLVAEVSDRVDRLGEQRRGARADPASELDARDARVADDRGEDGARPDVDVAYMGPGGLREGSEKKSAIVRRCAPARCRTGRSSISTGGCLLANRLQGPAR